MIRYLAFIIVAIFFIGCANKTDINVSIPDNISSEAKEALKNYQLMKEDKSIEKAVPAESYKASKLAQMLVDVQDNPELAKHYAYLLNNQVEMAKLAKKRLDMIKELNGIVTKRNEAINEMKKELQEDDSVDSTEDSIVSVNETKVKELFDFTDDSFTINGKYFDNDDVIPNKNLQMLINYLVKFLEDNPNKSLELVSYTDGVGSSAYSIDLSLRRANRIKEMLVDKDVEEDRVVVEPKGATDFIASNDSKDGRIQNNRIVVNIK